MNASRPDAETVALIKANSLRPDALEANRSGLLTPEQIQHLRSRRFSFRTALLIIGLVCVGLGAWDLGPGHQASPESGRFGAFTAMIGGVGLLALRFSRFGRSYSTELAAGRVASVDGFVRVRHSSSNGESGTYHSYYYIIDGHEFESSEEGAKLLSPQSRYRVYYVPNSDMMVNIEPLGTPFAGSITPSSPELDVDEISAIVGEPMRVGFDKAAVGSGSWPGMIVQAFESTRSRLCVVVGFLLGGQDSSILAFYERILKSGPGSSAIIGLGDEAIFSHGQLLVRRGEIFIMVTVISVQTPQNSEHVLDIEQRLAAVALSYLPPSKNAPPW